MLGGWLGCLGNRGVQVRPGLVRAGNADGGEADRLEQVTVVLLGEGGAATGPLLGPGQRSRR